MKTLFLVTLSLFIFSGCTNNSLRVSPKNIYASSCDIKVDLKETSRSFHSGPLHISRYIFEDTKGNILVKERGRLDHSLMFIVGPISLMYAGFEFKKYSTHSLDDYHDFIEGVTRDGEQIYLLVQSIDEGFSIIYSKNPNLILPLANCLGKGKLKSSDFDKIEDDNSSKNVIKSDWSAVMFIKHDVVRNKNFDGF